MHYFLGTLNAIPESELKLEPHHIARGATGLVFKAKLNNQDVAVKYVTKINKDVFKTEVIALVIFLTF